MKRGIIIALISLVVSLLHAYLYTSNIGNRVEPWALDLWYNIRGTAAVPEDIVIVAMDESSYSVLNIPFDRAWPRATHAQLLEKLAELGAKRVLMDILFLGESADPEADAALATAMQKLPVVIGVESVTREVGGVSGRYALEEVLEPYAPIKKNAERTALPKMTEQFGYIRSFQVERSNMTKLIPTLYEAAVELPANSARAPAPQDMLWYYGPPGTITTIPYHQVLTENGTPKGFFKGKTVFVGLNFMSAIGPAQKDTFRTSFESDRPMFGVEIQATAAANILTNTWVKRLSKTIETSLIFVTTFLITFVISLLRPQWASLVAVVAVISWSFLSYIAAVSGFFIPGVILVSVIIPLVLLGSTLSYYVITYRTQQQVEHAFQLYLSPEMAKAMRQNPKGIGLGGENVYATALFTDIESFSQITEKMIASDVSNMLNAYFTDVMDDILQNEGTLIKFIGDAVFALWGAPIKIANHAERACQTALEIQKGVQKFNATKRFPALNTRIGINTGPMLVGNLGSERRFDFTGIGDSVNLASRLEGINKYFGTLILISDTTLKELPEKKFHILKLGTIKVAGKDERVGIHTIFDAPLEVDTQQKWERALKYFKTRKWIESANEFNAVSVIEARLAKACAVYIDEINQHETTAPSDDWDGEVEFKSK